MKLPATAALFGPEQFFRPSSRTIVPAGSRFQSQLYTPMELLMGNSLSVLWCCFTSDIWCKTEFENFLRSWFTRVAKLNSTVLQLILQLRRSNAETSSGSSCWEPSRKVIGSALVLVPAPAQGAAVIQDVSPPATSQVAPRSTTGKHWRIFGIISPIFSRPIESHALIFHILKFDNILHIRKIFYTFLKTIFFFFRFLLHAIEGNFKKSFA